MIRLKRKRADRDQDDYDPIELEHPPARHNIDEPNPFTIFANLYTLWKTDLTNTNFFIANIAAHPPRSTLTNSQIRESYRQQKRILDLLIQVRIDFFKQIDTAEGLFLDQVPYSLDFASDVEEIVKGLRYVAVRWESWVKRNSPANLQNGKWVSEVGMLANQMWMRLSKVRGMLEEIEEAREDMESEWRRLEEVEGWWREEFEKLLKQGETSGNGLLCNIEMSFKMGKILTEFKRVV